MGVAVTPGSGKEITGFRESHAPGRMISRKDMLHAQRSKRIAGTVEWAIIARLFRQLSPFHRGNG